MQEIKITEQEAGQRFDKLLGKYLNKARLCKIIFIR